MWAETAEGAKGSGGSGEGGRGEDGPQGAKIAASAHVAPIEREQQANGVSATSPPDPFHLLPSLLPELLSGVRAPSDVPDLMMGAGLCGLLILAPIAFVVGLRCGIRRAESRARANNRDSLTDSRQMTRRKAVGDSTDTEKSSAGGEAAKGRLIEI